MLDTAVIGGEKDHAEYSASGSERWMHCAGSIQLSKKAPPQRESVHAREGTIAHECFEFLLKNKVSLAALTMALKKYDLDMVTHAETAAHWVLSRLPEGAELLCETKVDSSPFTCPGQFGTLDAAIVEEFGRLIVIDYKYGAGVVVEPEGHGNGNSQLVYYALALSHKYHHNFSEVELVVIQPRAYHASGETIRSFIMPMEDLLAWEKPFKDAVKATKSTNPTFKGGKWCRFCPATLICPEVKEKAMRQAQLAFSETEGFEKLPDVQTLPLPNLSTILDACDKLESWITKVREHAFDVLERGVPVPGFKLVQKHSTRRWVDEKKAIDEARTIFGRPAFKTELLSPAQLEKHEILKKHPLLSDWLKRQTTKISSGLTLVKDSDKRPAVVPAIQDFENKPHKEIGG